MSIEFKDKEIQKEYDMLLFREDELSSELEDVQNRLDVIRAEYEQE